MQVLHKQAGIYEEMCSQAGIDQKKCGQTQGQLFVGQLAPDLQEGLAGYNYQWLLPLPPLSSFAPVLPSCGDTLLKRMVNLTTTTHCSMMR